MVIEYLKTLDANKSGNKLWKYGDPEGFSISTIEKIEQKINNGNHFPKAFREFLFIAGESSGGIGIGPSYGVDIYAEDGETYIQQLNVYKKLLVKKGLNIDRPFIVFKSGESSSFDFIYLDEGDDPRPRFMYLDDNLMGDDPRICEYPEKTFSELIDRLVDYALRGLVPF
ncbi:MAG: hypothetical protein ACPGTO_11090 [Polaribacter sp.]